MVSSGNSCRLLLDVGGTFLKAVAADGFGELLPASEFSVPMPSDGTRCEIVDALTAAVVRGAAFAASRGLALAGIGVAFPGPFDYAAGVPRMTHKFRSIYGVSLAEVLHGLPEVGPDMPVSFMHDVNAVLAGELACGNACGYADAAVVTLGTGLGFAHCRGGEIRCSPLGSPLLPIYNRPYRDGIVEDWVSKRGFMRVYGEVTGRTPEATLTVADLGRMAGAGDAAARETFARVGAILAASLRELLPELRTECLLLGGQISRSFVHLEPALREGLQGLPELRRIAPVAHIGAAAFYGLLAQLDGAR